MILVIPWRLTKCNLHPWLFPFSTVTRTWLAAAFVSPSSHHGSLCWRRYQQPPLQQNQSPRPFNALGRATREYHSTISLSAFSDNRGNTIDDSIESSSNIFDTNEHDDIVNVQDNIADHDSISLIHGIPSGHYVIRQFEVPSIHQFYDLSKIDPDEIRRLSLTPMNVTLPVALMILDPIKFPSFSKARKFCRKGHVVIRRTECHDPDEDDSYNFINNNNTINHHDALNATTKESSITFDDITRCFVGRVGDRVRPGDAIAEQIRIGNGKYPILSYYPQPFDLPVIYEDDYMALVNKPAGVIVHKMKGQASTIRSLQECLPFVVTVPSRGTYGVLTRPQPVHRLDKPTSGIMVIAKTKPAMQNLCNQFEMRRIKKTYTAIVNGIPSKASHAQQTISSQIAHEQFGVDADPNDTSTDWHVIEVALEDKEATTIWRPIRTTTSLKANDGTLTVVEVKPRTGRFHQIRRHMAWVCNTPLVGDDDYDGGQEHAKAMRDRGLFLCSNQITLEHPYYNTDHGRGLWNRMTDEQRYRYGGNVYLTNNEVVMVTATIDLPSKFENLLNHEERRAEKFR
jgi:23S rRNA pseudouridine1911/1915/1917 synthase